MDKVPKIKIVSINFCCAVFSLLDFLTLEAGMRVCPATLVQNYYSLLHNIQESADVTWWLGDAGLGLALRGQVQSNLVWRSSVPRTRIYDSLAYLSAKFKGETLSCIRVNMV